MRIDDRLYSGTNLKKKNVLYTLPLKTIVLYNQKYV